MNLILKEKLEVNKTPIISFYLIPIVIIFVTQIPSFVSYQYVFYKNRLFPIDTESRQITFGNGTNRITIYNTHRQLHTT